MTGCGRPSPRRGCAYCVEAGARADRDRRLRYYHRRRAEEQAAEDQADLMRPYGHGPSSRGWLAPIRAEVVT